MTAKNFRKDINGLRAVAVAAVLVFHFSNAKLPGGFAGVDVFFVISGYLMTSIIFRGLADHQFSIWRFWAARARRIVPALMLVVGTALVLGYLVIDPANYKDIGKNGFSSLLFISNITYNTETGYFDVDEGQNAFLHTWSLSVEWQFYLLYPLILVLLARFIRPLSKLRWAVLGATLLLFGLGVYLTYVPDGSAYYLFPARAWELLLGGLAFLFPLSPTLRLGRALEILGLAMILASFWVIRKEDPWPGFAALLPTLGTLICILAAPARSLLSNVVFQKIGLISYSLYLVHWVILAYFDKLDFRITWLIYLGLSFAFAALCYLLVERRRRFGLKTFALWGLLLGAAAFVRQDGAAYRIQNQDYALTQPVFAAKFYGGVGFPAEGREGFINGSKPGAPDFILTGDSLARQYAQALQQTGLKFVTVFADGCFSSANYINWQGPYEKTKALCERRYASLQAVMRKYPDVDMIVAHNWHATDKLVARQNGDIVESDDFKVPGQELNIMLADGGSRRRYFFIGQPPGSRYNALYQCLAQRELWLPAKLGKQCHFEELLTPDTADANLRGWIFHTPNTYYLDLSQILCRDKLCTSIRKDDNMLIYTDRIHFTNTSTAFIVPQLLEQIRLYRQLGEAGVPRAPRASAEPSQKQ